MMSTHTGLRRLERTHEHAPSVPPVHTFRLFDHDTLAFLVEPSPEGLARGIEAALSDPATAARRAETARALVEREYSPDRYLAKIRGAYEGVVYAIRRR